MKKVKNLTIDKETRAYGLRLMTKMEKCGLDICVDRDDKDEIRETIQDLIDTHPKYDIEEIEYKFSFYKEWSKNLNKKGWYMKEDKSVAALMCAHHLTF